MTFFAIHFLSEAGRELLIPSLRGGEIQEEERLEKPRLGMARRCHGIVNLRPNFNDVRLDFLRAFPMDGPSHGRVWIGDTDCGALARRWQIPLSRKPRL